MTIPPPSERIAAYRACTNELGECYCYRQGIGVCYRGPLPPCRPAATQGTLAAAVAVLGVFLWPLGPVAWWLAHRAVGKALKAGLRPSRWATGAAVLGGVLTGWCVYVLIVIAYHYG